MVGAALNRAGTLCTLQTVSSSVRLGPGSVDAEMLESLRHGGADDCGSLSPPLDLLQSAAVTGPLEGPGTGHHLRGETGHNSGRRVHTYFEARLYSLYFIGNAHL